MQFTLDGRDVPAEKGLTIMEAADSAGVYIPRLCSHKDLSPYGSCRVCTVLVDGRPQTACTQPVRDGMVVESDTVYLRHVRRYIIDMLFIEGNHYCMFCEKSGVCELQALAYRFGITAPRFPFRYPRRTVDASHPDIFIDHNRCIFCARCIRASRDVDKKNVFGFVNRSATKRIAVNAAGGAACTNVSADDKALSVCPVGTLMKKRVGYAVPIGRRRFDRHKIGFEIEGEAEDTLNATKTDEQTTRDDT
ncbi:MAG: 2Fe-2S iron-sulfur cluster binding domain-containing protein [Chitinivibrionales bacterium]|nr:2Fe-2S iron-sulfur cluster binding domain-containing protein [Chitinivibrionales bacterium]MBD3357666.1 2Fe-2S iron-sulfur cluster binding domain-containing protein [Chitinivibrionales bacterium]